MTTAFLDVDDEITSAVARLRDAGETYLVLVLPPGSRIATSRINFRLLAREARDRGRNLSIVCPEPEVRALAASAGLPAFATVTDYEAAHDEAAQDEDEPPTQRVEPAAPAPQQASARLPRGSAAVTPAAPPPRASAGERRAAGTALAPRTAARSVAAATGSSVVAPRLAPGAEVTARETRITRGPRRRLRLPLALLILLLLGAAGAAAYLVLPSAQITLTPRGEPVAPVAMKVVADPAARRVDPAAGIVPAQRVEVPLEVRDGFQATGVRTSLVPARGTVRFQSENTLNDVTIPAGTRLLTTSAVSFFTLAAATVPRASFATGRTYRDVAIQATEAGPAGNVPAGSITRLSASLAEVLISATNRSPTTGGSRSEVAVVTQRDYDAARQALEGRLRTALGEALKAPGAVPEGTTLAPESATVGQPVTEPAADELIDRPTRSFDLTLKTRASVLAVDGAQLAELAAARLRATVDAEHELFADSVRMDVGPPVVKDGRIEYAVQASAEQWRRLDGAQLLAAVRGRAVEEARSILQQYGDVDIDAWPAFLDRIPALEDRVKLIIRDPRQASR